MDHLFNYNSTSAIWYRVISWMHRVVANPPSTIDFFKVLEGFGMGKRVALCFISIFHAVIWSI